MSLGTKKEDGEGEGYLSVVHGARHRGEVAQHHLANKYFWSRQIFLRFTKNIFALYKKYFWATQSYLGPVPGFVAGLGGAGLQTLGRERGGGEADQQQPQAEAAGHHAAAAGEEEVSC